MITLETISPNILKVTVPPTLKKDDFAAITPQIDALIARQGNLRLLIDATQFNGWQNIAAFEQHMGFVKTHQSRVGRAALIAGHEWQHWLGGIVRLFVHPHIRVYDKDQEADALRWLSEPAA